VIDWISKNKEWFLSGAGLWLISSAVAIAFSFPRVRAYFRNRRIAANTIPPIPTHTHISKLMGSEVARAIRNTPVLYQREADKPYIGVVVQWEVRLIHSYPEKDGFIMLALDNIEESSWDVWCKVRLSYYPDLGRATYETPITVTGRIAKAGVGEVHLDDVVLTFPNTDSRMEQEEERARSDRELAETMAALEEESARSERELDDSIATLNLTVERRTDPASHADALTIGLLKRLPVLKELPRNRPIAVVTVMADLDGNRLASEIYSFLKAHEYRMKTDAIEYVPNRLLMRGCFLVDRTEYLEIDVNFQRGDIE
jgi:hypothetical protein